jgi:hypothetical protein
LLTTQVLIIVGVLALSPLDVVDDLPALFVPIGIIGLSATQDIDADATAVRMLAPSERGMVNGIQKAGGHPGLPTGLLRRPPVRTRLENPWVPGLTFAVGECVGLCTKSPLGHQLAPCSCRQEPGRFHASSGSTAWPRHETVFGCRAA